MIKDGKGTNNEARTETSTESGAKTATYHYRPVLFFALAYFFTWLFWIPAAFASENTGAVLMLLGLLAPAVVSTVFVLVSGSDLLKKDLKIKLIGLYKVKWKNVFLAVVQFAGIVACSILLSLLFGQSVDQFSFTEDFSFTGVGIAGALLTVTLASIIEEVGWKGYCEDSIGAYMNWFWESMIFGALWSFWHLPLLFIKGTYQAGLLVNPLYVVNFFISGIPLGFIITWVYLASDRSILACMIYHLVVNFLQEKIAMTPETKCVETIVVTVVAAIIVLQNKDMFFEIRHVGRLLETRYGSDEADAKKAEEGMPATGRV
ncbi:MAG: CPBP family intramembrane metalloprotease [Lachnospiraceae bacterium]|nr:CPBP family intramembrane metalloprotease [Lachnospiraceae bacterium]